MKKLTVLALAAATASCFAFNAQAASSKGTIAIFVNALDNPYYAAEAAGAKRQAEAMGYDTLVLAHDEDVKKQNELFDNAIGQKVKGIIVDCADSTASVAAVQKAVDAGIPVALINREIVKDGIALVQLTHNNFQAGSDVANRFVELMGEKGDYVELTCSLADNNCVTRSKAFHQVLDQYPDMKMIARQDCKGALLPGKQAMDSILQANPNIKGVICGNGPVALGAIASLKNAGRNDVVVVGIDGSNDEMASIKAGELKATAMLQAQELAVQGVKAVDEYLNNGKKPEKERVMHKGIFIDKTNADRVKDFLYQ
ncbi:MAG: D-ribose ABC transporter substrate-binding protein [Succinivibrio sp.]|nr:D-ribose ABC transporter substrate-binding protein [Succinivibrio sp.]